eukprot:912580-Rhodomonas_salina.1
MAKSQSPSLTKSHPELEPQVTCFGFRCCSQSLAHAGGPNRSPNLKPFKLALARGRGTRMMIASVPAIQPERCPSASV